MKMSETYEYLPASNAEAETDQFFVIQDDGTFIFNRQVHYVNEVEDVKQTTENSQTCTIYDVQPQQFFMDVANNSSELIPVSDNYILPTPESADTSNTYGNNFLLQTVTADPTEQPEKDLTITVQFEDRKKQDVDVEVVNTSNKLGSTCTEITLSDEQFKTLERKGWVLIESNGKIYILDTFGLHEVTSSQGIIQNTTDETKIDLPEEVDSAEHEEKSSAASMKDRNVIQDEQILEFPMEQGITAKENNEDDKFILNIGNNEEKEIKLEHCLPENDKYEAAICQNPLKRNKIKIITKYSFKDIPDKIVLGKTRNGKRLVAKVVKRTVNGKKLGNDNTAEPEDSSLKPEKTSSGYLPDFVETEFDSLMQQAIRGKLICISEEILDASEVVTQLFRIPEFNKSVAGRNIVITKVIEKTCQDTTNRWLSFVTGFVKSVEKDSLLFIHVPHLLQKLTQEYEEYSNTWYNQSSRSVLKPASERSPDCSLVQVHISETKHNGVDAISFALTERCLPCKDLKSKLKIMNKLHACSTCASVFQTKPELKDHQESHAVDSDGALTIDTDQLPKDTNTLTEKRYYIVKTKKGTEYVCFQCAEKFNKLSNCIRHIRIHPNISKGPKIILDPNVKGPYECKMCTNSYYYSSSLTKHIRKVHIMKTVNTLIKT